MKRVALVLFVLTSFSCFSSGFQEDIGIGMTENQIIKKYGEENRNFMKTIDLDYFPDNEWEPDYFQFFSKEELSVGVDMKVYIWKKPINTYIFWLKREDSEWKVFHSVKYNPKIVNF